MLVRAIFVGGGCLLAWFIVLPMLAVLGGAALLLYATLAEISSWVTGNEPRTVDPSTLQTTARRICAGYSFSRR
jgi:hypothetical protein